MRVCICGTVKNCGYYLEYVLKNMYTIGNLFDDYKIFLYYDNSNDNTLAILNKAVLEHSNITIYQNNDYRSPFRTHRIAHGRNKCLEFIRSSCPSYEYFIMMDCDDVCAGDVRPDVLKSALARADHWDALSFRTEPYYDIWALSLRPYCVSFVHFPNYVYVLDAMKEHVERSLRELTNGELLECESAFNGFAIYRTAAFLDCVYDGTLRMDLIPDELKKETFASNKSSIAFISCGWLDVRNEDCEHRSFHMQALSRGCRIRISPAVLFSTMSAE